MAYGHYVAISHRCHKENDHSERVDGGAGIRGRGDGGKGGGDGVKGAGNGERGGGERGKRGRG